MWVVHFCFQFVSCLCFLTVVSRAFQVLSGMQRMFRFVTVSHKYKTLKSELCLIVARILKAEAHGQEASLRVLLQIAHNLMVNLVLRIYSTCSLEVRAALVALVLVLEVVQVSPSSLRQRSLTSMNYPSAVFTFGPGFRTAFTRGGGGTATNDSPRSLLVQLAPLLILFAFSILSNLPSLFSSPPVPDPRFSFSPTTKYHTEMESGHLGIHYYVNPSEFNNHPVIGAEMAKEGVKAGWVVDEPVVKEDGQTDKREPETRKVVRGKGKARGPALKGFEDTVERVYTNDLYSQCQRGIDKKQRAKDAELGIFGIGVDWDRVKEIEDQIVPSCKELERLGLFR